MTPRFNARERMCATRPWSSLIGAIAILLFALLAAAPATAQTQTFGPWHAETGNDLSEAFTVNEAKSTFGLICSGKCAYYVRLQKPCKDGTQYRAMVNTDVDARVVTLTCHAEGGNHAFRVEADLGPMLRGDHLGVALAIDGQFSVLEFSLFGAMEAMQAVFSAQQKITRSILPPPAAAPVPGPPAASAEPQVQRFGQWVNEATPDAWYAFTEAPSGASLGYTCRAGCGFYVHPRSPCMVGGAYDLVVSNQAERFRIRATCLTAGDWRYFDIGNDPGTGRGSTISISLLAVGEETPETFSLEGAKEAITSARRQWMQSLASGHPLPAKELKLPPPPIRQ